MLVTPTTWIWDNTVEYLVSLIFLGSEVKAWSAQAVCEEAEVPESEGDGNQAAAISLPIIWMNPRKWRREC